MYKNLTDYIGALERAGELARVRVPVDPQFEIAELTDRESKRPGGGRALLFENTGTAFPVLTNMMGFRPPDRDGARRGTARRAYRADRRAGSAN